jgi:hypothetical protein
MGPLDKTKAKGWLLSSMGDDWRKVLPFER